MIPEVMWAYHTIVKTGLRYPPFTLAFEIDVVAPAELIWTTAWVSNYDKKAMTWSCYYSKMKKKKKGREH